MTGPRVGHDSPARRGVGPPGQSRRGGPARDRTSDPVKTGFGLQPRMLDRIGRVSPTCWVAPYPPQVSGLGSRICSVLPPYRCTRLRVGWPTVSKGGKSYGAMETMGGGHVARPPFEESLIGGATGKEKGDWAFTYLRL